jgi:hypothetical protein
MIEQARCWETMQQIISLWSGGRKNAAKDLWRQLPEEFTKAVMHFALMCFQDPKNVETCPPVTFVSSYGTFMISRDILDELSNVVSEICNE